MGHVTCVRDMIIAYKILVWKSEGMGALRNLEDSIKLFLEEIGFENVDYVADDRF